MKKILKFKIRKFNYILSLLVYIQSALALEDGAISCNIINPNIIFSAFNPYDSTPETTQASTIVKCTNNSSLPRLIIYYLSYDYGNSGTANPRWLRNGNNTVLYSLYKDSAFTQILGLLTDSSVYFINTYILLQNSAQSDTYVVYAKIPIQPLVKPMTYSDIISAYLYYTY